MPLPRIAPATESALIENTASTASQQVIIIYSYSTLLYWWPSSVLGLGAGDLTVTTAGGREAAIHIPNVLFVASKVHAVEKLIAVKPERNS